MYNDKQGFTQNLENGKVMAHEKLTKGHGS